MRLQHKYFPVNVTKFLGTAFLQNTSGGWLLLNFEFRTSYCRNTCQELGNEGFHKKYMEGLATEIMIFSYNDHKINILGKETRSV